MKIIYTDTKLTRSFKLIITALVCLNLFFLGGTWLHNSVGLTAGNSTRFLLLQLDLAYENVLSAWYSSMLLLLVAIMCIFCFMTDKKRFNKKADAVINYGWIMLALVFATLSLDEMGSFHETIGDSSLFEIFGKSKGWLIFYLIIILAGAFMILFSWIRFRRMPLAATLMIIGVLLLLSNPLQENFEIESMQNALNPAQWKRPVIFILLEEGSEIFATICFLVSTMIYYVHAKKQIKNLDTVSSNITLSKIKLLRFVIFIIILLGALMAIMAIYVPREPNNEIGIPRNWFPSVVSFMVSCIGFYSCFYYKLKRPKSLFFFMSVLSVLISAYCGMDLYEHHFNELITAEKIFNWIIIAFVIILGIHFTRQYHGLTSKILVCLWVFFTCMAFGLNFYTGEFIFTGFSFFLVSLGVNYYAKNNTSTLMEFNELVL